MESATNRHEAARSASLWFRYTVKMNHEEPASNGSNVPDGQMKQPTDETRATAYHEAGHAVMAILLGRPIEKVTIVPAKIATGGGRLGACRIQKGRSKPSQDELEDDVLILLGGMVAESHSTGRYSLAGAGQDLRMVQRLLSNRAGTEKKLARATRRALEKTEHLLSAAVAVEAIQLIAEELLERETISGRAVRHLFQMAGRRQGS